MVTLLHEPVKEKTQSKEDKCLRDGFLLRLEDASKRPLLNFSAIAADLGPAISGGEERRISFAYTRAD